MGTVYEVAPEVRTIAQRVIDAHHPHLRAVRIEYQFRSKAAKHNGRSVAGTAKKVRGQTALLATPGAHSSEDLDFFLVTIAKDIWERLDDAKRRALVDHELQHCDIEFDEDGDAKLRMRGHDVEEFAVIVQRHGLWSPDLEFFVQSLPAEQMALAGTGSDDIELSISHTGADGKTRTVDTSTGELSAAANVLRHGSGILDEARAREIAAGIFPGQDTDEPE